MKNPSTQKRSEKSFVYGTALWFICKDGTTIDKILALNKALSVSGALHHRFVEAGVISHPGRGVYKTASTSPPTIELCLACYNQRSRKINDSKVNEADSSAATIQEQAVRIKPSIGAIASHLIKGFSQLFNKALSILVVYYCG